MMSDIPARPNKQNKRVMKYTAIGSNGSSSGVRDPSIRLRACLPVSVGLSLKQHLQLRLPQRRPLLSRPCVRPSVGLQSVSSNNTRSFGSGDGGPGGRSMCPCDRHLSGRPKVAAAAAAAAALLGLTACPSVSRSARLAPYNDIASETASANG